MEKKISKKTRAAMAAVSAAITKADTLLMNYIRESVIANDKITFDTNYEEETFNVVWNDEDQEWEATPNANAESIWVDKCGIWLETGKGDIDLCDLSYDEIVHVAEAIEHYLTHDHKDELECEIVEVNWDIDEMEDEGINPNSLPKRVKLPYDMEEDEVADYLSDRYGFCVLSFTYIHRMED